MEEHFCKEKIALEEQHELYRCEDIHIYKFSRRWWKVLNKLKKIDGAFSEYNKMYDKCEFFHTQYLHSIFYGQKERNTGYI